MLLLLGFAVRALLGPRSTLVGSAVEVKNLKATAEEVVDLTYQAKRTHSKLYGALDDIRSNRREKTPRPGFFNR